MLDDVTAQEIAAFAQDAAAPLLIADEDGTESATAEKRYLKLFFGRKVRGAQFTQDRCDYLANGDATNVQRLAEALVRRFSADEPGFLWIRAYANRDGNEEQVAVCKVRPASTDLVSTEPEPPTTSEAAYAAMSDALVRTNLDLRSGFADANETISRLSLGCIEMAAKIGRFEALQECGGNIEVHRLWTEAFSTVAPSVVAAVAQVGMAQAAVQQTAKPAPAMDPSKPRPESGRERLAWDVACIQAAGLDLIGQDLTGNKVDAALFNELSALMDQTVTALRGIKARLEAEAKPAGGAA